MSESNDRSLRVCSFESRRAAEMASLIHRQGATATIAPSMREVPLKDNHAAIDFGSELLSGGIDVVIFLTGVGASAVLEICEQRFEREALLKALRSVQTIVRGPKPAAVLQKWKVPIALRAAEPNTSREVLSAIDQSGIRLSGQRVAVQEYGEPNEELCNALRQLGADVITVPVYRWQLPEDTGPLEAALREAINSPFDLVLFTSAQQVRHVLQVAAQMGSEEEWRRAVSHSVVGSIGPTCSEALQEAGLTVDLEPSHPRMGVLVREAMDYCRQNPSQRG
jgi:uroporphyrinogen-III synthase